MQGFYRGAIRAKLNFQSIVFASILVFLAASACGEEGKSTKPGWTETVYQAIEEGRIAYKLTTPEELKALLGEPGKQEEKDGGGIIALCLSYPNTEVWFRKDKGERDAAFRLELLSIRGKEIDIGGILQGERQVAVKSIEDFRKLEIKNLDLRNLDLRGEGDYLRAKSFDSLTRWPSAEKLPEGFDPVKLLEEGKDPVLGIRALHEQGINGKGVGIAILDQPLLLGHAEYTSRLIRYDASRASWLSPQMHGSPVAGIAVGKSCGVAPGAFVFYYAGKTSIEHETQAGWIGEIIEHNETGAAPGPIRIISISANPEDAEDNESFMKARKKAQDAGILLLTTQFLPFSGVTLIEGKDPDKPESYRGGGPEDKLLIPTRNKTIASHQGINAYTYSRGLAESWAPPYLAGLAALALQVNPDLRPETIVEQWIKTATHTKAGPVVNPRGFIEAIKSMDKSSEGKREEQE